jgi:hypothetical protein
MRCSCTMHASFINWYWNRSWEYFYLSLYIHNINTRTDHRVPAMWLQSLHSQFGPILVPTCLRVPSTFLMNKSSWFNVFGLSQCLQIIIPLQCLPHRIFQVFMGKILKLKSSRIECYIVWMITALLQTNSIYLWNPIVSYPKTPKS